MRQEITRMRIAEPGLGTRADIVSRFVAYSKSGECVVDRGVTVSACVVMCATGCLCAPVHFQRVCAAEFAIVIFAWHHAVVLLCLLVGSVQSPTWRDC